MRVLLIHNEVTYYAGAEKVLGYFLNAIPADGADVTLATVPGSKVDTTLPSRFGRIPVGGSERFSPIRLSAQATRLWRAHRRKPFDVIHGWTARDWELTSLTGWLCARPTIGTLHDHPQAGFIRLRRHRLMRTAARWGLDRVVCVSQAVARACADAGYPPQNLEVVRNGLPPVPLPARSPGSHPPRLGYLGVFSARKGLGDLFHILAELARLGAEPWELQVAGEAVDDAGRALKHSLVTAYAPAPWWPRVHWTGWVDRPMEFLGGLDLLLVPSAEFDPLPTVLIEAGYAGTAVLAAAVGGVPEIVQPGENGWLFAAGDWVSAAGKLRELLRRPERLAEAGRRGRARMQTHFSAENMVAQYQGLYSTLARNGPSR